MPMDRPLTKIAAMVLRTAASTIEANESELDDDEIKELVLFFTHRKINIEQTCQRYGISRATLNRWQGCGKLPPFHKDSGGKMFLWQDEADRSIAAWNEKQKKS